MTKIRMWDPQQVARKGNMKWTDRLSQNSNIDKCLYKRFLQMHTSIQRVLLNMTILKSENSIKISYQEK
jgi:hypothetical protein